MFLAFIPVAAKMQDAVYDHTVQLVALRHPEFQCIFLYPVDTDEDIAVDDVIPFTTIKRNDIGIRVVLQVLPVDFQKISIAPKDEADISGLKTYGGACCFYPPLPG